MDPQDLRGRGLSEGTGQYFHIANPREGVKLGVAARKHVQARYSWEACLAPLDALIDVGTPRSRKRNAA